ncbi:hypothetical protein H6758_03985 [Candidatus Nomurabacteria bacterium]|nr:hypothetical protein [Candidatus Nomurabacteria bacterium]
MGGYIIAGIVMVVGFTMVWKSQWYIQNFGASQWAEQHMGSFMFYKLLGVTLIVVAFLGATGSLGDIILGIFGGLFGIN